MLCYPQSKRLIEMLTGNFGHRFLSLNCVHTSVGVPFDYRKSLERIRRMRNVTIYDFRQVHIQPVKKLCYTQSICLIEMLTGNMSFNSLKITLTKVFGGICNIIMIQSECTYRKLSFIDKK